MILWYFYGVSKLTRILNYGGKSYDQTENKVTAQANAIRSTGFSYDRKLASVIPASAEEISRYPYAIFAADESAGIAVNTDYFTLNGSAYTNGVFSATAQYPNINGTVTDADDIAIDDTVMRKIQKMYLM